MPFASIVPGVSCVKRIAILVAAVVPVVALAVSKDMTARAWLQQVPPLPDSAMTAYAQWNDDGSGGLTEGSGFKGLEDGLTAVAADQNQAAAASPQVQQQMAMAQQMQQMYGSPEGQAKLRSMSPAELMAMAQQMQPPQTASGPISAHDQALVRRIGPYPGTVQVEQDVQKLRSQEIALEQQWNAEAEAIGKQEQAAESALPICHNEAGEPSDIAVREVRLSYASKSIDLANKYLPKFEPLVQQLRATLGQRIDYGDDAMVAWSQIQSPTYKQQMSTAAHGAENTGLGDVGLMESFIKDPSKKAAQAVADKKNIERVYANAKGC